MEILGNVFDLLDLLVSAAVVVGFLTGRLVWLDQADRADRAALRQAPKQPAVPTGPKPLPIDPKNPPKVLVYRPDPATSAPPPLCYCHQTPLRPGQRVWSWPLGDGRSTLVCHEEGM